MTRLALLICVVLLASGCRETRVNVRDSGPTSYERGRAMEDCTGTHDVRRASDLLRVACTFAVYGGKS
jgi:hypothetical protein